jgi:HEAT repeat protein
MVREWRQTITVTPRDVAELARVASEFRDVAMSSTSAAVRSRAVMSLAYLTDPVAIPYLRDVVIANHDIGVAVAGILRIGGPSAAEALRALAASPDPEIAALASDALRRIR